MKFKTFKIGKKFWMSGKEYLCTDIGTRTVIAVQLSASVKRDPTWLNGPPYAVAEYVIDEYDQDVCTSRKEAE
jgi:hypothetical protein